MPEMSLAEFRKWVKGREDFYTLQMVGEEASNKTGIAFYDGKIEMCHDVLSKLDEVKG